MYMSTRIYCGWIVFCLVIMKPIVKYQGGKSKELPLIKELMPKDFDRIVEPFCGGAAVTFGMETNGILNDTNKMVTNLYREIANYEHYREIQSVVDWLKKQDHDTLEKQFYHSRDVINGSNDDQLIQAVSYIIVRQLCFSGMERYNAKGEFNVPFGHYKKFSCNLSEEHHNFLKECDIRNGNAIDVFDDITDRDFIFVDPPYLERLGYTTGDGGQQLHEDLLECLKNTSAKWMIVHSDHDFYRDNYKGFNIQTKDFVYAQRFGKNKNHSGAKVQHLYITNY